MADYYISVNAQFHAESFDTLSIISGQPYTRDFNLDQVPEFRISGVVSDQNGNALSGFETFATKAYAYASQDLLEAAALPSLFLIFWSALLIFFTSKHILSEK